MAKFHIVCHSCEYEELLEGAQAEAAFKRDTHRDTHPGHDVELGLVDGADVHSFVRGAAYQTVLLSDVETRDDALESGRWIETGDPINATDRR